MKINVNSWHYRLIDFTYDDVPESLCPYFWKLIVALIVVPIGAAIIEGCKDYPNMYLFLFLYALASLSVPLLVAGYYTSFYGLLTITDEKIVAENMPYAFIIGVWYYFICIANIVNFALSSMALGCMAWDSYRSDHPKQKKPKGQTDGNIVVEFIKAKKNKYCPRIDFVDDKADS